MRVTGEYQCQHDGTIDALRRQIAQMEAEGRRASTGQGALAERVETSGKPTTSNDEDPREQAFQRIVILCSYHDFSREKMRQRLKREEVPDGVARDALDRAVACGLIDDVRYGEALCAGRMHALRGRSGIESELWQHHIDPAAIEGWPYEYEERYGTEMERALQVIERHPPRSKNPRASAYRRLVGKGYAASIARQASWYWWNSCKPDA